MESFGHFATFVSKSKAEIVRENYTLNARTICRTIVWCQWALRLLISYCSGSWLWWHLHFLGHQSQIVLNLLVDLRSLSCLQTRGLVQNTLSAQVPTGAISNLNCSIQDLSSEWLEHLVHNQTVMSSIPTLEIQRTFFWVYSSRSVRTCDEQTPTYQMPWNNVHQMNYAIASGKNT